MNWLDGLIIIFLFFALYLGACSGIIGILTYLFSLILGIFFARYYHPMILSYLPKDIPYAPLVSYILIFSLAAGTTFIAGRIVSKIFNLPFLKFIDRVFGALLGLIFGLLFASMVIYSFTLFRQTQKIIINSKLAPVFLEFFPKEEIKKGR